MRRAVGRLVEPRALLLDVALIAVSLQHGLAHRAAARAQAARGVLEGRLGAVPVLRRGHRRGHVWKNRREKTNGNSNRPIFFSLQSILKLAE